MFHHFEFEYKVLGASQINYAVPNTHFGQMQIAHCCTKPLSHIHNVYIKLFDKQVLHAVICNISKIMLQSLIHLLPCLLLH